MDRNTLLRNWLRSKSIHPADIAAALLWLDEETKAGRNPKDSEVLARADECHANAVKGYSKLEPTQILVKYELSWKIIAYATVGSFVGGALSSALMRLLL